MRLKSIMGREFPSLGRLMKKNTLDSDLEGYMQLCGLEIITAMFLINTTL